MPDYAGYAAALTIRDNVFDDGFLTAYHAGQIAHSLVKSFQQVPAPAGSVNFFFQSPQVVLSATDPTHAIMRLTGWGTIRVRINPSPAPSETRSVQWQADILLAPQAEAIGSIVLLS